MTVIRLAWGARVSKDFVARLNKLCKTFQWDAEKADWLMACMAFESAGTFSPSIRNAAGSGARGLIQFMPRTAQGLGTTTEELAKMTAVEQLDWVEKYFRPYRHRVKTMSDMYMAILWPAAVGKVEEFVLFSGGIAYRQNAGLDTNKDGIITKREAAAKVAQRLVMGKERHYAWVEWED
jgi:hypothetical protein